MSVNTGTYLPFLAGEAYVTQQYLETVLNSYVTNTDVASSYVAINSAATLKSVTAGTGSSFIGLSAGTGTFTNFVFNGATAASASVGTITIPVTAAGYMDINIGATTFKLPYYNS